LSEWRQPKDYVRPEERRVVIEEKEEDIESDRRSVSGSNTVEKGILEKQSRIRPSAKL
jgi:hypothetical protein